MALSVVPLFGIKLLWRGPMKESKKGLMRLTSTLEITLSNTLQRLIGLNSLKVVGTSTLGIGTIRVSVSSLLMLPVEKAVATRFQTSLPTIC